MTRDLRLARCLFAVIASCFLGCGGAPVTAVEIPPDDETDGSEEEAEPETFAIALRFEDAGTDETETPHTRVVLVRIAAGGDRTMMELARETGACYHETPSGQTLIAARCWWAGAGAHYTIERVSDDVVALRTDEDEGQDAPGEPVEVGRFELSEHAVVQVLGPDGTSHLH